MQSALSDLGGELYRFDGPAGTLSFFRAGTGYPLVMLHSLAMSAQMWAPILPEFLASREVIVVDARGHGQSSWNERDFTVEEMAEDLAALFDHAGIDQADVLGLSMGGSTALTFAGGHPTRVRRLILCDTTAWYGPTAVEQWKERAATATSVARVAQVPFQLDRWFTREFQESHQETVHFLADIFERTDSAVHRAACQALGALDARQQLMDITAFSLVLTGSDDKATPIEMGQQIASNLADAVFVVVPGSHFAIFESADARAAVLSHLLRR